jgi:prevent-host-death family protein
MTRLTATEASRDFSRLLNRVGAGEEVEVVRNGVPVVRMRPAGGDAVISAAAWRELIGSAPGVDEDFEREVREAREEIGPPRPVWPS